MVRVKQMMSLLREGRTQILSVAFLHRRIFMGESQRILLIQPIQYLSSHVRQLHSVMDRLPASAGTSARTRHNLHEIVGNLSLSNCLHKFSCVPQPMGNCHMEGSSGEIKGRLFPSFHSPHRSKRIGIRILSCSQPAGCAQSRLHHTARRAENDAGPRRSSQRLIKLFFRQQLWQNLTPHGTGGPPPASSEPHPHPVLLLRHSSSDKRIPAFSPGRA